MVFTEKGTPDLTPQHADDERLLSPTQSAKAPQRYERTATAYVFRF